MSELAFGVQLRTEETGAEVPNEICPSRFSIAALCDDSNVVRTLRWLTRKNPKITHAFYFIVEKI